MSPTRPPSDPAPTLAYVETSLPGTDEERRRLAVEHGLALEIEDWGDVEPTVYQRLRLDVVTVQTCRLKREPPTAPGRRDRAFALRHVEEAIELADRLAARQVLTVCAYGPQAADSPFERTVDLFDRAARRARALGVRILVEPLSPLRSPLFHDPVEVVSLLRTLDQPDEFGLALDTGHLLDGARDPEEILAAIDLPVHELQLRGAEGAPPAPNAVDRWLAALRSPPEVVAVEHRQPITQDDLETLIDTLRRLQSPTPENR